MSGVALRPVRTVGSGRLLGFANAYGVYVAIAVFLVLDAIITPGFIGLANARVQVLQIVPVLLVALGMALVIGTEGIDLSVGAVIAMAAAVIPLYLGYGAVAAIVVALVIGAVSGVLSGLLVAVARVQPIVATLALMIGLRGVAVIINGATAKEVNNSLFDALGIGDVGGIPWMAVIGVVLVLVVAFVVRSTTFGRQLVAVGDSRAAATLAGLPVRRVLVTVYVASGVLAAAAGVLIVGNGAQADPAGYGLNYELFAITAVVVGGTPLSGGRVKVGGTAAGAVLMQLITATLTQHAVPNAYSMIVQATIIILAVYAARGRVSR